MEQQMTLFCDIDLMMDNVKVLVRCINIWKSHAARKPNEPWGLDVVLQDLEGNRIQASIKLDSMDKFLVVLDEGPCYRIRNFIERGDGVTGIKRRRHDLTSDGVVDLMTTSGYPFNVASCDGLIDELDEYGNARNFYPKRIINRLDGEDLAFPCMISFRKFVTYFDPFLPMNIITRKAYNTIMVEGLESTGRNLVAIDRDVYVFVGSFTYAADCVVLEDIGEFVVRDMANVAMGRPFRAVTQLEYACVKGLISFTRIFYTYIFQMPRTIPRLKNFNWNNIPPLLVLSQHDLMSRLKHPYEKNKLMYKNCLNLGPEYQVDETMKEWLIRGHVIFDEKNLGST
ncbi:homeodomain-like protein [Tanacetum coccineum]